MSTEKVFLSVNEACAMLGVGRTLLYTLIRQGTLPTKKLGRRTLIPRLAAESLAAGPEQKGGR